MTHAAYVRKESRFIPYHYREDYPETDNANWCGQVLVSQREGKISTQFKPLLYHHESQSLSKEIVHAACD
jgi:succinate dehydrogenase/fumarate reductase flavoprotein subunit